MSWNAIGFVVLFIKFKDEPPRHKERKEDCFLLIRQEKLRISNNPMPCGRSSLITLSWLWSLLFSGSSVLIPKKGKSLAPLAALRFSIYRNFQENKSYPLDPIFYSRLRDHTLHSESTTTCPEGTVSSPMTFFSLAPVFSSIKRSPRFLYPLTRGSSLRGTLKPISAASPFSGR